MTTAPRYWWFVVLFDQSIEHPEKHFLLQYPASYASVRKQRAPPAIGSTNTDINHCQTKSVHFPPRSTQWYIYPAHSQIQYPNHIFHNPPPILPLQQVPNNSFTAVINMTISFPYLINIQRFNWTFQIFFQQFCKMLLWFRTQKL